MGCLIDGGEVRALVPPATRQYGEARTVIELSGAVHAPKDKRWDELHGIFAVDEARGATLCLTRQALYELQGTTWTKVADIGDEFPNDVSGDVAFGTSNGAGGVWDPVQQQVVFWCHDGDTDVARFFAVREQRLVELPRAGLPDEMWESFGSLGFAVCAHEQHGVVVLVAGTLYARTPDGFAALPTCPGAPPACKVARMAHDPVRRLLVVGPHTTDDGEQPQWYVLDEQQQQWRTLGDGRVELPFQSNTSFADHLGVAHAVDIYLRTWARRDQRWVVVVNEQVADELRATWAAARDDATRVQCVLTAFDGALHVVMDDGRVAAFDGRQWVERVAGNPKMELRFPQAAFDGARIVVWGSEKKTGGLKNEAWFFNGTSWTKGKKQPEVPAGRMARLAMHNGQLMRLTDTSLSVLEGELFRVVSTWTTPLSERRYDALVSAGAALQFIQWTNDAVYALPIAGEPQKLEGVALDRSTTWFVWQEEGAWRVCDQKDADGVLVVDDA